MSNQTNPFTKVNDNSIIIVGNPYFPTFVKQGDIMEDKLIFDAKVMSKGQVTIPKKVRDAMNLETGDRITFVVEGSNVRVVNSIIYAMTEFQEAMKGEAEKAGFYSEEDVAEWIMKSRRERGE